jgi:hypothetical protein
MSYRAGAALLREAPRLPFIGYDPLSPLRRDVWETVEMGLRLDDRIRKTVVFVGSARHGRFNAIGTAFVALRFEGSQGFQYLVTCKHVIDMVPGDIVHVRVNRLDGKAQIIETTKDWWTPHPDKRVDLMVCPTRMPIDQFDLMHLDLGAPYILHHGGHDREEIGIGDDVFVPGMYVARVGEARNMPILRTGALAAMPEEKIETQMASTMPI